MTVSLEQPSRRSRIGQWLLGGALLLVFGGLVWYYGFGQPTVQPKGGGRFRQGNAATPVRVVPVEQRDIQVTLKGLGTVTPINMVTVRSRLDGELVRVHFTEGQRVSEGQLLAEIDARPYEVALAQAEGLKAENQARLNNARVDLESFKALYEQQLIPKQQLTSQEALVKQAEGAIQSNDAQVANARLQLAYTRVIAPISGRLGLRQVDAGNLVRSGDANGLVVITQMQPMSVLFPVPEADLPAVQTALRRAGTAQVEAWDRTESQRLAVGVLKTIDNQIDTTTGTIRLRAEFANADERLFPNQFVNIRLNVSTVENATVVPAATIQRASFGTFVYVIKDDDTATVRQVTLGPADGDHVAIADGLVPGERVVLEGVDALREGVKVEVVSASAPPAAAATPRATTAPRS